MKDLKDKVVAQWDLINKIAVKRFGNTPLAEEAALVVMDGLRADNWRRIRDYKGRASFSTFIGVLAVRLMEDFARSRFGRPRPPAWLKGLGAMWKKLYNALCLERLHPDEAVEVLCQNESTIRKKEIENAAFEILARIPHCGAHQGLETVYDESDSAVITEAEGVKTETVLEKQQVELVFKTLLEIVLAVDLPADATTLLDKYKKLKINLKQEERLLLKLCYQEDLSVAAAGKMIGMNRFQAHGRMKRLLSRLRDEFERVGLGDELRLLLKN